jgi:hypothetical protein
VTVENIGSSYADMGTAQTQMQAQTQVMSEAVDAMEMQGEAAVQLIQSASEMTSSQPITDPALGQNVDLTA